jgi:hypothetical protein
MDEGIETFHASIYMQPYTLHAFEEEPQRVFSAPKGAPGEQGTSY